MSSDLPRYTLRVDPTLLAKIAFIAQESVYSRSGFNIYH